VEKAAKDSAKPIKDAASLDAFAAADITWLDELARLADKLPPPEAAQLSELTAQAIPKGGGGQIKLAGNVDTSVRVAELEDGLRDKEHSVSGKGTANDPSRPSLPWAIDETVLIAAPVQKAPPAAKTSSAKTAARSPAAAKTPARQGGAK
jgi:hypothetical protein